MHAQWNLRYPDPFGRSVGTGKSPPPPQEIDVNVPLDKKVHWTKYNSSV